MGWCRRPAARAAEPHCAMHAALEEFKAEKLGPAVATRNASCYSRRPSPAQGLPMAAGHRITVSLECTECKRRNYSTRKNRRNTPEKINLKKYCASCKGHKPHKETK